MEVRRDRVGHKVSAVEYQQDKRAKELGDIAILDGVIRDLDQGA